LYCLGGVEDGGLKTCIGNQKQQIMDPVRRDETGQGVQIVMDKIVSRTAIQANKRYREKEKIGKRKRRTTRTKGGGVDCGLFCVFANVAEIIQRIQKNLGGGEIEKDLSAHM